MRQAANKPRQNPPASTDWMPAFTAAQWARGLTLLEWAQQQRPADVAILESFDWMKPEKYSKKVKKLESMIQNDEERRRLYLVNIPDQEAVRNICRKIREEIYLAEQRLSKALLCDLHSGIAYLAVPGKLAFGEAQPVSHQHIEEILGRIDWKTGIFKPYTGVFTVLRLFLTTSDTLHDAEPPATGEIEAIHTGFPGRPTSKHFINLEFKRRAKAGVIEETLAAEARVIVDWMAKNRPDLPPATPKTVENNIRGAYRKAKQNLT